MARAKKAPSFKLNLSALTAKAETKELDELKRTLSALNTNVDKLSGSFAQFSSGNAGSGLASVASGGAGLAEVAGLTAIAGPLAVVAGVLTAIAPLLDKLVTLFPELNASLQTLKDISKAGDRTAALADEASRHGVQLPGEFLQQHLAAGIKAEHAATRARAEVESLTTLAQARAFPFGD